MAGALLVALVYLLARQLGVSPTGAFVAGLVVTICGQAIQSSIVVMSDIPALLWATASAATLLHYRQAGQRRWLVAAALLLAAAGVTRWLYLCLLLPWAMALLAGPRRLRRSDVVAAAGPVALVLGPPRVISQSGPYPATAHSWLTGWSPANALASSFSNIDGQFTYEKINARFYSSVLTDNYYLAGVFVPLCLLGLAHLLCRWRDGRAFLVGGWLVLPYLFLAGIPYQNIRFMLIMLPPVAVLAGMGVDNALTFVPRRLRWASLTGLLLSAALLTGSASTATLGRFLRAQMRDSQTVDWAAAHIPPGATVYTFELTLRLRHSSALNVVELFYETPESLAQRRVEARADYLLVNGWALANQWQGSAVQAAFEWLRTRRGLIPLGQSGNYQLYRIAP